MISDFLGGDEKKEEEKEEEEEEKEGGFFGDIVKNEEVQGMAMGAAADLASNFF